MKVLVRLLAFSRTGKGTESAQSSFCIKGQAGNVQPDRMGPLDLSHLGWHRDSDKREFVILGLIGLKYQLAGFRTIEYAFSFNLSCTKWRMKNPPRAIK